MKFNKFKLLAVTTVFFAIGINSAQASNYDSIPEGDFAQSTSQSQQITQEDLGKFFKGVWGKTKEVASNVADKTKEVASTAGEKTKEVTSTVGVKVGQGLQSAGKGIQEMAIKAESNSKKSEIENPNQINANDVIKAKDKLIDGVTGFLNKLRSEPGQENNNSAKPF